MTASACQGADGGVFEHHARLTSSSLLTARGLVGSRAAAAGVCGAESTQCAPSNMSGRIYAGGAMLGELGPGAFNLTMLAASEEIINDPSHGMGGTTEFNLQTSELFTGMIAAPAEDDMPDPAVITRVELMFDYLDVAFSLTDTAVDGQYEIRTVFATEAHSGDVDGTMYLGDRLVRSADEPTWTWCNADLCSAQRADVEPGIIVDANLVGYEFPGQGNPDYVPFAVELQDEVLTTYEQITAGTFVWDIDFAVDGAVRFASEPITWETTRDIVRDFALSYAPTKSQGGEPSEHQARASLEIRPLEALSQGESGAARYSLFVVRGESVSKAARRW
ncbi:MAG: hypothetical protein B7733_20910 [Myxococcales bacterium FL481]|nr:MAG: hypothetical protein B7733_20910 [Myxococcales bacterium FL481]